MLEMARGCCMHVFLVNLYAVPNFKVDTNCNNQMWHIKPNAVHSLGPAIYAEIGKSMENISAKKYCKTGFARTDR